MAIDDDTPLTLGLLRQELKPLKADVTEIKKNVAYLVGRVKTVESFVFEPSKQRIV